MEVPTPPRRWIPLALMLVAFAAVVWFLEAQRKAEEDFRRQQRLRADQWIEEEKKALRSGRISSVYFYSTSDTDRLLHEFAGMTEVKGLMFELTDLSDEGVKSILELPNVASLTFYGGYPRVGNDGLATLSHKPTIETLKLVNIDVTDDGLAVLPSLPHLKDLTIYREKSRQVLLTDKAVRHLRDLRGLKRLNISGGWMSEAAIGELRESLPNCDVVTKEEW